MNLFPPFVIDKRRFYAQKSKQLFFIKSRNGSSGRDKNNIIQMLLIGVCLGVTFGIALIPIFELDKECSKETNAISHSMFSVLSVYGSSFWDFKQVENPNIVEMKSEDKIEHSKENSSKKKKIRRPRFYSSELGIRKRLIASIIYSDLNSDPEMRKLMAINRTLSNQVDQILFFFNGVDLGLKAKSLGFPSESVVIVNGNLSEVFYKSLNKKSLRTQMIMKSTYNNIALKAIKHLGQKFIDSFDFFFISLDFYYVNGRTLSRVLNQVSVTQDDNTAWGISTTIDDSSCLLEKGFIMSRRVVQKLSSRVDRCLASSILALNGNLNKCFQHLSKFNCSRLLQGHLYTSSNPAIGNENDITIGPFITHVHILLIHRKFVNDHLTEVKNEIGILQKEIQSCSQKMENSAEFTKWPLGVPSPRIPESRFDLRIWELFTLNNIFPKSEHNPVLEINKNSIDWIDILNVVNKSLLLLSNELKQKCHFQYGYRRYDPTRGMEYLLDFHDKNKNIWRIEGLRPLSKVEVIPIPYVTESRRIIIYLIITAKNFEKVDAFLENYFDLSYDKKHNAILILGFITTSKDFSQLRDCNICLTKEQVERAKQTISQFNSKTPDPSIGVQSEYPKIGLISINFDHSLFLSITLKSLDLLIKKLNLNENKTNSLILLLQEPITVSDEFLNRAKMNTIPNWQIFNPVPFALYQSNIQGVVFRSHPGLRSDSNVKEIDIHKNNGYFNGDDFRFLSFYSDDYINVRKKMDKTEIADNAHGKKVRGSLLDLFVQHSPIHIFRAPDPGLKIEFNQESCYSQVPMCLNSMWASKTQLAKIIFSSDTHFDEMNDHKR